MPEDDSNNGSSHEEVEEVIVLSYYEPEVQMVAPVVATVEGDRNLLIEVEELLDVTNLPEADVIKQ